jgi:hypothetical protein
MLDIGAHDSARFIIIVGGKFNAGVGNHPPAKLPQGDGAQAGKTGGKYIFSFGNRPVKKG